MRYIVWPEEPCATERVGGKAGALAALGRIGCPVPPWFAVLPEAFNMDQVTPARDVLAELQEALAKLCPSGELVAVRSSAAEEDGNRYSFAGQLDSFLFVHPAEVGERVARVWRSALGERALAYRREHGLTSAPRPAAVLVQRMVTPALSGVAFGADPVTGRGDVAVVAAVYGLGTGLVSGDCDADTYQVGRDGSVLGRQVAHKRWAHRHDPGAPDRVRRAEVPEPEAGRAGLSDEQIRAVASLARRAGRHFARPQDIEWAITDGRLYLLQSRPITSLSGLADPSGAPILWDNSNITESFGGVTTPLTFSFARRAYEEVYRQFCRLMGVPEATIAAQHDLFRRMLGLIRGRVYYNLLSWYRLLAMLPGFRFNRHFMEQMMGVREALPEGLLPDPARPTLLERLGDGASLLRSLCRLVLNHILLPFRIRHFYRRLNDTLGPLHPPLEDRRPDELVAHYRDLERQLLTRWDAPLINDFFAMIFVGLLRRFGTRWCGDETGSLANDLLRAEGGMISAEPARRIREMARVAAGHPAFAALLCSGSRDAILEAMDAVPPFKAHFEEYLDQFGDRCLEELKLESLTLHDDPLVLLRAVGQLASRLPSPEPGGSPSGDAEPRRPAEDRVRRALARQPLRRWIFRWALRNARARTRDRENLRLERTRVFGRARRLFVEFGRRLYALDLLQSPEDVFYLEVDELLGFVEGTATCTDLRGLVALRKAEFALYRESEPPADRFVTRGVVYQGNRFQPVIRSIGEARTDQRTGMGGCPGVARGPVRVVTDPRTAVLRPGEILVADRTDPGWVVLFPCAAGLVLERGSLLSHSAIVARELGIPTVLAVNGATHWLKDGDWVELDGRSGVVRRIEAPPEGTARAA